MTYYEKIQVNRVARAIAAMYGVDTPEGYDFSGPKVTILEQNCWNIAVTSFDLYKTLLR